VKTPLKQAYPCRYGVPVLTHVETDIFRLSYFGDCMGCNFCHDACCAHGADVTAIDLANMAGHRAELEQYVHQPYENWYTGEFSIDADWPGGKATRTKVVDGHCVFLNVEGRGCLIHRFAIEKGIDAHEIKPMICLLWPVTWQDGMLQPSNEIEDGDLICVGPGQTCYRSARNDIGYYFGPGLVAELDELEQATLNAGSTASPSNSAIPLRLVPPDR
jgi:Fe-S-cluster containining protein